MSTSTVYVTGLTTGLAIGDITIESCALVASPHTAVTQVGITLTEVGTTGCYYFSHPGIAADTAFAAKVTADPTTRIDGVWPITFGDDALNSTVAKEATLAAIQLDASGYVKSSPQTAVTVNPAQVLGGALQPLLPIHATATIEAPQSDVYPLPWAIGSQAAKADARFFFIAKVAEGDADDAATNINQEITIADPANVAGMNVLTAAMTATIKSYHAKVKRVDADGIANQLTVWVGRLNVVSNVG